MGGEWEGNDSLFCLLFCFTRPFFFFLSSIYVKRIWNRVDMIDRRILMVKMRQWTHLYRVFFHADYENLVYFASSHQDFFLLTENLPPLFNKPLNGFTLFIVVREHEIWYIPYFWKIMTHFEKGGYTPDFHLFSCVWLYNPVNIHFNFPYDTKFIRF